MADQGSYSKGYAAGLRRAVKTVQRLRAEVQRLRAKQPPPAGNQAQPAAEPAGDVAAVLAAMAEDPDRRDLYLGAGGHWCFVTCTEGMYRIHLNAALQLEREGRVVRKWTDYPHYWRLARGVEGRKP